MLTLDLEAHRELIIERTLSAGNLNELRWLFTCYPREEIVRWVQQRGAAAAPSFQLMAQFIQH